MGRSIKKKTDCLFNDIFNQTVEDMKSLGTYREEFSAAITAYAQMQAQLQLFFEKFCREGCEVSEDFTNKAGATNSRKTVLYQAIESLRKDIAAREMVLGLNPAGMARINRKSMETKKKGGLAEALNALRQDDG